MKSIDVESLSEVSGGNPAVVPAVMAGVATFTLFPGIVESGKFWVDFGQRFGQAAYEINHPNDLGQMVFTKADFNK